MYYLLRKLTKKLYHFQGTGLPRLAESIRKITARYGPEELFLIDDFFCSKFYCNLREHMSGQIFFRGSYSSGQLKIVKELLPPDGVFLDIGANQGEFTIFAAQIMLAGKVISFEPCSKNLERLHRNIEINGFRNVEVIPVALGDSPTVTPIYSTESPFTYDGSRHEGLQTLYPSVERPVKEGLVKVCRLDDILDEMNLNISRISLIKIDIEGSELFALRGAKRTIGMFRPPILIEINSQTCETAGYHQEEIIKFLYDLRYELYRINDNGEMQLVSLNDLSEFQNCLALPSESLSC